MKNGKCPSCRESSVYTSEQGIMYYSKGLHVQNLGELLITPTSYQSYVCTKCGYFENSISDQSKLNKIEQKWKKVE